MSINPKISRLQSDPSAIADIANEDLERFSQHYVAFHLGAGDPPGISKAIESLRQLLVLHPDPSVWMIDLKAEDGTRLSVPRNYRIEVIQVSLDTLVIQSFGVHWDSAAHLAHALAQYLLRENNGRVTLALNPDLDYKTDKIRRVFAYGFLDNRVHWIDESGAEVGGQG